VISFSAFSTPRNLHSFPTRRSSDLKADDGKESQDNEPSQRLGRIAVLQHNDHSDKTEKYKRDTRSEDPPPIHSIPPHILRLIVRSEDTRLNSSHVKISYAVFCLKKK